MDTGSYTPARTMLQRTYRAPNGREAEEKARQHKIIRTFARASNLKPVFSDLYCPLPFASTGFTNEDVDDTVEPDPPDKTSELKAWCVCAIRRESHTQKKGVGEKKFAMLPTSYIRGHGSTNPRRCIALCVNVAE